MLWRPAYEYKHKEQICPMHYFFTNTHIILFKKLVYSYSTQILTSTLNILTVFVYVCEYSMCVSRIAIAIKFNEFSTKDLKKSFCKTFRFWVKWILTLELIFRKIQVRVSSDKYLQVGKSNSLKSN